jgi:hypothetical protein
MDYFEAMSAFVRAVDLGSFSKAAAESGLKVSTVSRYVSGLEADLGAALLNRSTRRLNLTEAGRTFYDWAAQILEEADRFVPREDSLTVRAGMLGAYPNMFFVVPEDKIGVFSAAILNIKSAGDYERLVNNFGVRRSNEQFWSIFDAINSIHISSNSVRAGALDLTRYSMDAK